MLRPLVTSLLLATTAFAGDLLLVCGGDEVFQTNPAANPPVKLWSWRANDRPEIPADLKGAFNTTDECKPLDGGKRLLVTSSGGGCALLELPSGKALWWARVPNAHSIEALPGGKLAVASSVNASGNKVLLFDEDGHDLRAVPGSPDLMLSTHASVWRFHRDDAVFRPDPDLKDRIAVKSADLHPATGRLAVVQASGKNWWTETIELLHPAATLTFKGETLYKARWLTGGR